MYPIARINNASLIRDPGYRDPWREVLCAQRQQCAPPQIINPKNTFIGKNLSRMFINNVPPVYFPACGDRER